VLPGCAIRRESGFGKLSQWMSARNPGDDLGLTRQNANDARATDGARNSPHPDRERMKDDNGSEMGVGLCSAGLMAEGSSCGVRDAETPKAMAMPG